MFGPTRLLGLRSWLCFRVGQTLPSREIFPQAKFDAEFSFLNTIVFNTRRRVLAGFWLWLA